MHVSQGELCEIFGFTPPTAVKYRGQGLPVYRESGGAGKKLTFETIDVHQWLVRKALERAGLGEDTDALDSERELALLRRSQREVNELKAAEIRSEVIPQDEAVRAWSAVLTTFRSRILAVPPRMRSRLPDMPADAYDELQHLLREALDELSRTDPLSDTESTADSSAAA